MKKSIYFLLFLFIGTNCYSQEVEKLPEQPWMELVEMNSSSVIPLLPYGLKNRNKDINVKLEGNYTKADSISISKVLKKLDTLTETISINFFKNKEYDFRIKFLDSFAVGGSGKIDRFSSRYNSFKKKYYEFYVYDFEMTDLELKNSLEFRIANLLVGSAFAFPMAEEKRQSIFNPVVYYKNEREFSLNDGDIAIIKEVYRTGFEERLAIAEKQFKEKVLKKIEDDKIATRDQSLWWVKNPIAVIFLPVLILALLALFFVNKTRKILDVKIKKHWLQFGAISLVVLFFIGILIVFCVSFYDFLTIPDDYTKVPIVRKDTIVSTIAALVPLFPFLFLFRLIEFKIQKSSQNIFIKTILVFLSTGVLPFLCIVIAFLFALNRKGDLQGGLFFLSQVFLVLMSIAFLRALISYFIFKERSLVIENEKKLSNLKELKSKAELKSLQSQINPHFLYNSLNSIASLAPIDSKRTQEMAHSLSDLFKYSINRKGKKMSTIKDEINMVNTYLGIEKIRFGERLKFVVEVDKAIENHEIPLFLIQPLIENAVKHGISKQAGNGEIRLKIKEEKNELIITVSDSGPNFPKGLVSGHGLQTVYDLLRLGYGDKASLNWTNLPEKTITITMPKKL